MATGPEIMRQVHLETMGDDDAVAQRYEQGLELRKRWLSVYSALAPGGQLYTEKPGVATVPIEGVIIAWRELEYDVEYDWELVKSYISYRQTFYVAEQPDWLIAYLNGDQIVFGPHALKLLDPYILPEEVL